MVGGRKVLSEVLPKAGLVYSEKGNLSEVRLTIEIGVENISPDMIAQENYNTVY